MSALGRLRALDVYGGIPVELSEPTTSGGLLSVFALLLLSLLFLSEISSFLTPIVKHELVIEQPIAQQRRSAELQQQMAEAGDAQPQPQQHSSAFFHSIDTALSVTVHLNMTFYAIPCVCLGLEVQDLFGSLGSSSDKGLLRYATTLDGVVKPGRGPVSLSNEYGEMQRHVGEGCNIFGQLTVESVPGNFRLVPALSFAQLQLFYPQQFINTSHTVHFLYFGDLTRAQLRHEKLSNVLVLDSIRDHTRTVEDDESAALHQQHLSSAVTSPSAPSAPSPPSPASPPSQFHFSKSFEYYLKIVATHYTSPAGVTYRSFQYTSHGNDVVIPRELPAIWFRYDFSPITIKVSRQHASLAHFLVQLCAILGGTFSVLRIVHALIGLSGKRRKGDARNAQHEQQPQQSVDAPAARIPQSAYVGQLEMRRGAAGAGGDVKPLLSPETRALLSPTSQTTQQQFTWTGGDTMGNGGAAGRQGWTAENGAAAGHAQQQQQQQRATGAAMQRQPSMRSKGHDD